VICRLPQGAVVLPGLDFEMDERSWDELAREGRHASIVGHPQFGLRKLLRVLGARRDGVEPIGKVAPELAARGSLLAEALRPAETTDMWAGARDRVDRLVGAGALAG